MVNEILSQVDHTLAKRQERIALSDEEKRAVRGQLATLEQLVKVSSGIMPILFMHTRNRDAVIRAYSVQLLVSEQLRILPEDQYIMRPNAALSCIEMLRSIVGLAKEWGHMHAMSGAQADARAAPVAAQRTAANAAGQDTPLTNMHPGAVTSDPSLEKFQKAVKHPLDPGSLKLPAAKKRAMSKSTSFNGGNQPTPSPVASQTPSAGQPPQVSAVFAPAPLMLPPDMSREEFDRLPQNRRMEILMEQQVALRRQNASGIELTGSAAAAAAASQALLGQQQAAVPNGHNTNPLLLAAMQGISTAMPSEEEERLKALEKDKWNNPLDYLMCVLGKFTKGAEKAGMEPAPILQQAFWPIARKSMSSNWGVIATDAVL
ncbi:hypothetical protein H4S01_006702 [Coemansia sp. RSA 2610]|nr:hypothetical protein H4S01_006702 [Coemansia sp. RSA 2610]